MADERTGLAVLVVEPAIDEIELIDDVEALEDLDEDGSDDASTGAFARLRDAENAVATPSSPPPRPSSPPPVPPEARQSRPPDARGSVPPLSRSRSHSGMFRIDHPSSPPPVPRSSVPPAHTHSGTIDAPEAVVLPVADGDELRETHAYAQRLRLVIRLRDDRIRELEVALREQQQRADDLARQLSQFTSQPVADDLKRISGIGPGFERALHAAGVTSFDHIAQWTREDIERIAAQIRTVPQRIVRGGWIERARELVAERAT